MTRPYLSTFDRSRYPAVYLLRKVTEAAVQSCALQILQCRHIPALATDAGAGALRGRIGRALRKGGVESPGAYLKGVGGAINAGLSDIVGCMPGGRALFIEVKAPEWTRLSATGAVRNDRSAGKPTPDQLAFLDTMAAAGALVGVIWHTDDLIELLEGVADGM